MNSHKRKSKKSAKPVDFSATENRMLTNLISEFTL